MVYRNGLPGDALFRDAVEVGVERENAWAPRYVGNELAGTIQAAEQHRHTATVREAEAEAATVEDERAAPRAVQRR